MPIYCVKSYDIMSTQCNPKVANSGLGCVNDQLSFLMSA